MAEKIPLWMHIKKGTKDIRCPKCKQGIMVSASGWRELPVGFGSRGGKFVIDKVRYTGWYGECPKHGKVFAWYSKQLKTLTPRGINTKLRKLQQVKKTGKI